MFDYLFGLIFRASNNKGCLSSQELISKDTQAPNIQFLIVTWFVYHFWCKIVEGSAICFSWFIQKIWPSKIYVSLCCVPANLTWLFLSSKMFSGLMSRCMMGGFLEWRYATASKTYLIICLAVLSSNLVSWWILENNWPFGASYNTR